MTYNELVNALATLINRIQTYRSAVLDVPIKLLEKDARHVGLGGIQMQLAGMALTAISITKDRTAEQVLASFAGRIGPEAKKRPDQMVAEFWKLSLLALPHFKLDSLVRNLLRAMGKPTGKSGFGSNFPQLLGATSIKDSAKAEKTLKVWSALRNTLHSNGIHHGTNLAERFYGMDFEFEDGKDIQCASFEHIIAVIAASLDVFEEILSSKEIRALAKVEDAYTELTEELDHL